MIRCMLSVEVSPGFIVQIKFLFTFAYEIAIFQMLRSGLRLSQEATQQTPQHSTLARPLMRCHVTRMANMTLLEQHAYFPGTTVASGTLGAQK